ncbi:hypothetical protein [Rhizobium leguminosarum]|uniref:hypothetical protein n=1 Tax=Rhizobium leguminosarum TaxID=384 RepID=UPI0021BBF388|nr:hypothetical protein [Rhizobium leguminosarum]
MIDASIAVASDAKETLQIPKIFSAVKLQDCNHYDSKERRACEATTLRLGYFSWGLLFAARGFDLTPRILRGDLKAFREFVKDDPVYSSQASGGRGFLEKALRNMRL